MIQFNVIFSNRDFIKLKGCLSMGLRKETAIEFANEKALELKRQHFVIASPDTYNDIFNDTQYKVVDTVSEDEQVSVVYKT